MHLPRSASLGKVLHPLSLCQLPREPRGSWRDLAKRCCDERKDEKKQKRPRQTIIPALSHTHTHIPKCRHTCHQTRTHTDIGHIPCEVRCEDLICSFRDYSRFRMQAHRSHSSHVHITNEKPTGFTAYFIPGFIEKSRNGEYNGAIQRTRARTTGLYAVGVG